MKTSELAKIVEAGFKNLEEKLGGRIDELDQRLSGRMDRMEGRMDRLEDGVRRNGVEIEGLRGDIRQVADGVAMVNEKLDRHIADTTIHSASAG